MIEQIMKNLENDLTGNGGGTTSADREVTNVTPLLKRVEDAVRADPTSPSPHVAGPEAFAPPEYRPPSLTAHGIEAMFENLAQTCEGVAGNIKTDAEVAVEYWMRLAEHARLIGKRQAAEAQQREHYYTGLRATATELAEGLAKA